MQSVLEILGKCQDYLAKKGVENAKLDAQIMLARALGCKRLELFLRFEDPVTGKALSEFREMTRLRAARRPLQHILGDVDFFGLTLRCDARALVPRPETEEMCEFITQKVFPDKTLPIRVLDLGTGSGAIAIALKKHYSAAHVTATDLNPAALSLAKENAALNNAEIDFLSGRWFDALKSATADSGAKFDLIVSNPPYIPESDFPQLQPEVRLFDPKTALVSPDNGLADLAEILENARNFLAEDGALVCECGLNQAPLLAKKAAEEFGYKFSEAVDDLTKRPRFLFCKA